MMTRRRFLVSSSAILAAGVPVGRGSSYAASNAWSGSPEFLRAVQRGDAVTVGRMRAGEPALARCTDEKGRSAFVLAHLGGFSDVAGMLVEALDAELR